MLTSLRVENFKALKDVKVDLTPMHVLIGTERLGKTTILEALAAVSRSTSEVLSRCFDVASKPIDLIWQRNPMLEVVLSVAMKAPW